MNCKQCRKCGAKWIDGQLFWSTGKAGKEEDLAGLVCNTLGDENCINPLKGSTLGDSWAQREREAAAKLKEWEERN